MMVVVMLGYGTWDGCSGAGGAGAGGAGAGGAGAGGAGAGGAGGAVQVGSGMGVVYVHGQSVMVNVLFSVTVYVLVPMVTSVGKGQ